MGAHSWPGCEKPSSITALIWLVGIATPSAAASTVKTTGVKTTGATPRRTADGQLNAQLRALRKRLEAAEGGGPQLTTAAENLLAEHLNNMPLSLRGRVALLLTEQGYEVETTINPALGPGSRPRRPIPSESENDGR